MPREEKFLFRFCIVQTSPASPKKINCPGHELGENNVGRQHARHDEVEQRGLQDQRAPESNATTAQRATEKITGPHSADPAQGKGKRTAPSVWPQADIENGTPHGV